MTHFVLLTISSESDLETVEQRVKQTYLALDEALPFLNAPAVYRSCVQRDSNADIMIKVQLDSKEQLQTYLTHPLHVKMGQDLNNDVIGRVSFDYL